MGREGGNGDDTYASLVAQLEEERAARQALEAQVRKLSERLNTLSTTMFAMVRGPSESRSQERLTPSVGGNSPLLSPPKAIPVPQSPQIPPPLAAIERSGGTPEIRTGVVNLEEDFTEDDFQTPHEDRPPLSYGAFGEELRPDEDEGDQDDPKRKKAARTLSLSQLTMSKAQKAQV
jgi:hypothetical protein